MARKIAIYGKGGIGKSTISSNLTAALSDRGIKVMQIGCDPKHDSTRALIGGKVQQTVLNYLRNTKPDARRLGDIVAVGYKGCLCVEAGGPEPGVGCAGRGIISAFELLDSLGVGTVPLDLTLYDVLGDVVCGGFAVPLRNDNADTVYIVTSGEFMSIYAANNILRGTANYNPDRIGGIIFNSRGDPEEEGRVEAFAKAVGIPIIARFARSNLFMAAEKEGKTFVELYPDSAIADSFRELAAAVLKGQRYAAHFLTEGELESLILGRKTPIVPLAKLAEVQAAAAAKQRPYSARTTAFGAPLNGCAFSGACSVCSSVSGLTVLMHGPRSCAEYTVQLDANCTRGACQRGYESMPSFADPDVHSTDMKEDTMIFGGTKPLGALLEGQIGRGRRDFAIVTACPPGIIGDDVRSLAENTVRAHPGVKIAVLDEDGNAAGDFMQGVIDAGVGLVRTFAAPSAKDPESVNLIGTKTMSSSCRSDVQAITDLLTSLGLRMNCCLPGISSLDDIRGITRAAVNLKINPDVFTDRLCVFLHDEYGLETLAAPVRGGLAGTCAWLNDLAARFGREKEAAALEEKLKQQFAALMTEPRARLAGKTCCIISVNRDVKWIAETAAAAGLRTVGAWVENRPDYIDGLDVADDVPGFVPVEPSENAWVLQEIDRLHPDLLLTPVTAAVDPHIYQSKLPLNPPAGPFAGRLLAEDWLRGMLAPAEEGWRTDAAEL
ncbi:MAG: nitrogenase component 1 [Methanomethylophilus sp.]